MAYVKQGPWIDGSQLTPAQITAMDQSVADSAQASFVNKGNVSGSITLDAQEADVFGLILTGDTTISLVGMSVAGKSSKIRLSLNSNMHTVTWADTITWSSPLPPLTGNPDLITIQRPVSSGPLLGRHDGTFGINEGALPAIGSPLSDGYFAGIMDTTRDGVILPRDVSQVGQRYALVITGDSQDSRTTYYGYTQVVMRQPEGAMTAWDGLTATLAFEEVDDTEYAGTYHPNWMGYGHWPQTSDGASRTYVPAVQEIMTAYRNLKPTTRANGGLYSDPWTGWISYAGHGNGYNPAADPVGADLTPTDPPITSVPNFQAALTVNNALGRLTQQTPPFLYANAWRTSSVETPGTPGGSIGYVFEFNVEVGQMYYISPTLTASSPDPGPGSRRTNRSFRRILLPPK